MSLLNWVGVVLGVALCVYLLIALCLPEKFT